MLRERTLPSDRGFTVIEILVALVIAGIGLSALMGLISSGLGLSGASGRVARETALARSVLERFGNDMPVQAGVSGGETSAGELAGGFHWRGEITLFDPTAPPEVIQPVIVTVTVWDKNEADPGVRLTTLRMLPPLRPDGTR